VFFKSNNRTFYAYGFPKANKGNINKKQLRDFKIAAKVVFGYSEKELDERVKTGLKRLGLDYVDIFSGAAFGGRA